MLEPPVTPIRKANDGLELPATGFGTYKVNGLAGVDAIKSAIHQGYRLIDSAFNYENEGVVGRAIRESGVPREDIIVTSKLPGRHHAHDEALLTIEESVCRMGLDYIDLYLIHWPNPSQGQFVEAWEALVEARERGLVKHIGVSNFLPGHIDLLIRDTGVTPAVNQVAAPISSSANSWPTTTRTASSPRHRPLGRANQMLFDPDLNRIAAKHGISVVRPFCAGTSSTAIHPEVAEPGAPASEPRPDRFARSMIRTWPISPRWTTPKATPSARTPLARRSVIQHATPYYDFAVVFAHAV